MHIKSTVVPVLVVPLSKWFGIVRVVSLKRSTAGDFAVVLQGKNMTGDISRFGFGNPHPLKTGT